MKLKLIQTKVNYLSFLILLVGILFISGCVSQNAGENVNQSGPETAVQTAQGLQIVLKDLGFPEIKYLQPTIKEIQLQNEAGKWITIWSNPEGKTVKLTPDGAETMLDIVNLEAGTYVATRLLVSTIDVEADINRDGDTLDKNVEVILTEEEFNSLPQKDKPQAPQAPEAPQKPQKPQAPQAPEAPQKPQKPQAPGITGEVTGEPQEQPQKPEKPLEPSQPPEPDKPQEPQEPQAPYRIEGGLVYTGEFLDEKHTVTPPYWDGIEGHTGEYLFPIFENKFIYGGSGGKIIYDFTLHPQKQKAQQISVEVFIENPPSLVLTVSALTVSPASVIGSTPLVGTVTLSSAAPAGGQVVQLSAAPGDYLTLPGSVTVKAGETSGTFNIETKSLPPSLPSLSSPVDVTITAKLSDSEQTALLKINPIFALSVSALTISPASVVNGARSLGTVTLNYPAPRDGISVKLSSTTPNSYKFVGFSTSMRVKGGETSGRFEITTKTVSSPVNVTFTASIERYNTTSKTASLIIIPAQITRTISSLTLSPDSVIAGDSLTGTVTLDGAAPAGGQVVQLWTIPFDSPLTLPSFVTVKAGETSSTFHIDTRPATSPINVTIIAQTYNSKQTALLIIVPFAVA